MTSRVRRLTTVVHFHPEAGLIVLVLGLDKVDILMEMAALRGFTVSPVNIWAMSAAIHEGRA